MTRNCCQETAEFRSIKAMLGYKGSRTFESRVMDRPMFLLTRKHVQHLGSVPGRQPPLETARTTVLASAVLPGAG